MLDAGQRFGNGPLARAAALIYTLLVVEALFLATGGVGLVPLVLLDRDASNLPLVGGVRAPGRPGPVGRRSTRCAGAATTWPTSRRPAPSCAATG